MSVSVIFNGMIILRRRRLVGARGEVRGESGPVHRAAEEGFRGTEGEVCAGDAGRSREGEQRERREDSGCAVGGGWGIGQASGIQRQRGDSVRASAVAGREWEQSLQRECGDLHECGGSDGEGYGEAVEVRVSFEVRGTKGLAADAASGWLFDGYWCHGAEGEAESPLSELL